MNTHTRCNYFVMGGPFTHQDLFTVHSESNSACENICIMYFVALAELLKACGSTAFSGQFGPRD